MIPCTLYSVSPMVTFAKSQYNQDINSDPVKPQSISITTRLLMLPCYSHTHFRAHHIPSLIPGNHWSFSISLASAFQECYLNAIHSTSLFRWLVFAERSSLKSHTSYCPYQSSVPFYCWVAVHGMGVPQCVQPVTHWRTSEGHPIWRCYEQRSYDTSL